MIVDERYYWELNEFVSNAREAKPIFLDFKPDEDHIALSGLTRVCITEGNGVIRMRPRIHYYFFNGPHKGDPRDALKVYHGIPLADGYATPGVLSGDVFLIFRGESENKSFAQWLKAVGNLRTINTGFRLVEWGHKFYSLAAICDDENVVLPMSSNFAELLPDIFKKADLVPYEEWKHDDFKKLNDEDKKWCKDLVGVYEFE